MKIWFQNRRTKWKKQDNISNAEAAEHKNQNNPKGGGGGVVHQIKGKGKGEQRLPAMDCSSDSNNSVITSDSSVSKSTSNAFDHHHHQSSTAGQQHQQQPTTTTETSVVIVNNCCDVDELKNNTNHSRPETDVKPLEVNPDIAKRATITKCHLVVEAAHEATMLLEANDDRDYDEAEATSPQSTLQIDEREDPESPGGSS